MEATPSSERSAGTSGTSGGQTYLKELNFLTIQIQQFNKNISVFQNMQSDCTRLSKCSLFRISFKPPTGSTWVAWHFPGRTRQRTNVGKHGRKTVVEREATSMKLSCWIVNFNKNHRSKCSTCPHSTSIFCRISVSNVPGGSGGPGIWEGRCLAVADFDFEDLK